MPRVSFVDDPSAEPVDALVIPIVETKDGPQPAPAAAIGSATGAALVRALHRVGATGGTDEVTVLPGLDPLPAGAVVATGLGSGESATGHEALRVGIGAALRRCGFAPRVAIAIDVRGPEATPAVTAVTEGALLGGYRFGRYRSDASDDRLVEILLSAQADQSAVTAAQLLARHVNLARDLVNTPAADLSPRQFADIAAEYARPAGVEVEILDDRELRAGGFGGIVGVGQGSTRPPYLVRLVYRPPGHARHVALVGKGITFDSGGLSLKDTPSMANMKGDMAGAAAVLMSVLTAARLGLAVAVDGWLPLADNMPSGSALRIGDVLTMYGGRRVEVLNTDAEGRLVLADALVRAAEEAPDFLIDIATLTGAQMTALGTRTAGVMGNNQDLLARLAGAADRAGESLWPMPMPAELRSLLKSPIADLANVARGTKRPGGMLVAAHFLADFVPSATSWAHLDIAGPAWNRDEAHGYTPTGGTGFGVRTLVHLLTELARAERAGSI